MQEELTKTVLLYSKDEDSCCCGSYNLPKIGKHVCCKGCDVEDVHLRNFLMLNNKTPVYTSNKEAMDLFVKSLSNLMNSMTDKCKFYSLLDKCTAAITVNDFSKGILLYKGDVVAVLGQYKGLVFSELDKNVNSWSVMCECYYKECMKKNFGKESAYYNEVDNSQKVVENNVVKQYDKRFGSYLIMS